VLENKVLKSAFRSEKEEVTGGWRKLHNEELHNWDISEGQWNGQVV
jgi:hypothetical protein